MSSRHIVDVEEAFFRDIIEVYNVKPERAEMLWKNYEEILMQNVWKGYEDGIHYVADWEALNNAR